MKDLASITLKDPSLLETRAYVNGAWIDAEMQFEVHDPATGALVARVADLDVAATAQAIDAAMPPVPAGPR